jgi:hypothetical protein
MAQDFFDPTPEQQNVVLVNTATLRKAQALIDSGEHGNPEVEIQFDNILDRVTDSDPSVTDYILEAPAKCPNCRQDVFGQESRRTRMTRASDSAIRTANRRPPKYVG